MQFTCKHLQCFVGLLCIALLTGSAFAEAAQPKDDIPPETQKAVDTITTEYLSASALLVQDKFEGVDKHLKAIRKAAQPLTDSEDAKIKEQAETVAKHAAAEPKEIKAAREAFKSLSAAVIGLVQIVPPSDQVAPALYEANCPMAKANWLQTSKDLANPYMGQAMPKCGKVAQTIKGPDKEKE